MKRTPYCEVLKEMGGKFVDFAGFDMPVQFEGILAEHKAVREGAGLFDVSHMGEFLFTGKGALATLQNLLCNDYEKIVVGKVKYSPMLNDEGGVVDDVLVYCINDECYFMCVNASNKDKDKVWAEAHLLAETEFKDLSDDTAQLAVQGPKAIKIIEKMFSGKVIPQKNYTFEIVDGILENKVILSRTGYTAEDGFEIYCDAKRAIELLNKVLDAGAEFELKLCGLGARDTLRLEGAMPLYGHEMNESTLATELGLDVFIKLNSHAELL
ncbi:MAG: glycine cleavage system aminomethyltransferase GcvT, partial [Clostridia bacterium]